MKSEFLVVLTLAALSPACVLDADPDPSVVVTSRSRLVVDWTIQGSADPDLCRVTDAKTLSVVVTTLSGRFVGDFRQSCAAFAAAIDLRPGDYLADAVLLDAFGDERTTPVLIDPFTLFGGDELVIYIDFPARSFY
ncbi:MAG: hypothetical protein DIU78_023490 [Pseudomonadota bacterium]